MSMIRDDKRYIASVQGLHDPYKTFRKNISKVFVSKLLLLPPQNQIYTRSQYMKFERYIIEQLWFILQFVQPKTLP